MQISNNSLTYQQLSDIWDQPSNREKDKFWRNEDKTSPDTPLETATRNNHVCSV